MRDACFLDYRFFDVVKQGGNQGSVHLILPTEERRKNWAVRIVMS